MGNNINSKEKFIETAYKLFEVKRYNATGLNEILKDIIYKRAKLQTSIFS